MKAMNIRPISELKNRTKALLAEVVDGGEPFVITQNGKPTVVVMSAKAYDEIQAALLVAILEQRVAKKGRMYTTAEVRKRIDQTLAKARRRDGAPVQRRVGRGRAG